jgi:hypothetical protein
MNRSVSKKKKTPNTKLLVMSIGLSVIIIFGFIAYKMFFQNQETKFSLKAAIVDQLSEHFSNATFITRATNLLTNAGFNVSYFSSENVTVPFYRELVEDAYGIIIFRAHSALRNETNIVDLFTSEEYDKNKYYDYRSDGLLSRAEYFVPLGQSTNKSYFAITPNFIEHFGHFPKSIVIAMGCSSLKVNCYGMAQAFIDKGAKAYVGWTETVLPNDTDYETAGFLEMFLAKNKTLAYAVANRLHYYRDPSTNINVTSRMEFYPVSPSIGNLRISDLIAEAKNSKTLTMFNNFERFSFLIANINLESKDFLMD